MRGRRLQVLAAVLLGIVLVGFVCERIYDRFFVARIDGLSFVTLDGTTLRATSSGQIEFVGANARGDPAFAIRTLSGAVLTVQMPCDCTVAPGAARVGDTVVAGETVMQVATADAPVVVHARVTPDLLRDLAAGDLASIQFPDGSATPARLDTSALAASTYNLTGGGDVDVVLAPTAAVPRQAVGTPVSVVIATNPFAGASRLIASLAGAVGKERRANGFASDHMCSGIGTRLWPLSRAEIPSSSRALALT